MFDISEFKNLETYLSDGNFQKNLFTCLPVLRSPGVMRFPVARSELLTRPTLLVRTAKVPPETAN